MRVLPGCTLGGPPRRLRRDSRAGSQAWNLRRKPRKWPAIFFPLKRLTSANCGEVGDNARRTRLYLTPARGFACDFLQYGFVWYMPVANKYVLALRGEAEGKKGGVAEQRKIGRLVCRYKLK